MHRKIAIIGLGYVGLPLAVEFGKKYITVGYDIDINRVNDLINGKDITKEITENQIKLSSNLIFSSNVKDIRDCNIYIISVPTPIDENHLPDLSILLDATSLVGDLLKKNDIVIFESTVYPGCTEEDCVPLLEEKSKLKYNKDFFCGYSPERINPGDKEKTVTKIVKVTSGSNPDIAEVIDELYASVITAGTYKASSIKVAEAAKVIENCQRDINIAFMNELSIIFNKMNLDTQEVLDAAGTKWNFLSFKPGLVGGHCIGVDPYYLTYKAKKIGYESKIIGSGRELNDSMPNYIYKEVDSRLRNDMDNKFKLLFLGVTFKENCPDIRNSKVFDIISFFQTGKYKIHTYDPYASSDEVYNKNKIELLELNTIKKKYYDCIIISVAHKEFLDINPEEYIKNKDSLVYDLKGIYKNKNYRRL
tara:strand:- start:69 stop:1325 length:1257 start_codon:yes stop_codon:yes gene_type:complete